MKYWILEVCTLHQLRRLSPSPLSPSQFILIVNNCEQKGPGGAGRGVAGRGRSWANCDGGLMGGFRLLRCEADTAVQVAGPHQSSRVALT